MNYGIIKSIIGWTLILEASSHGAVCRGCSSLSGDGALVFCGNHCNLSGCGMGFNVEKAGQSGVFYQRRICQRCIKLDRPEYYGRTSLFIQRMHHKPCGRLV